MGVATLQVPMIAGRAARASASIVKAPPAPAEALRVEVRTLDSYSFSDVALIKIDVEGGELDVLRGAVATVAQNSPVLIIEVEQRHRVGSMADVVATLSELEYAGWFLDRRAGLRPLTEFDQGRHQRLDSAEQPVPPYINNFIFAPRARRML